MALPGVVDGWICVPYQGPDVAKVELGIGTGPFHPAYLDWVDNQRVAKLRPTTLDNPVGNVAVGLRVNDVTTAVYRVTL